MARNGRVRLRAAQALRVFAERNVDIVDAIVHVTAQERGWETFSFDKDVEKLRGK